MTLLLAILFEILIIIIVSVLVFHYYKIYKPLLIAERLIKIYELKKLTELLKSKGESIEDLEEFYKIFQTKPNNIKDRIEVIDEEYKVKPSEKKAK